MKLALDTNAYSGYGGNDEQLTRLVYEADTVLLPFVVLAELRSGFAGGNITQYNERLLSKFLLNHRVSILYPDEQSTIQYAQLHYQLKRAGTPIPANDIWIAALVLQHGCILATRDKHFQKLPQIQLA